MGMSGTGVEGKEVRGFPPLINSGNHIGNQLGGGTSSVVLSSVTRKFVSEEESISGIEKSERIPSLPLTEHRHHSLDSSAQQPSVASDRPSRHMNLAKPWLSVSAREGDLREGKREGEERLISPRTMLIRGNKKEEKDKRLSSNNSIIGVNDAVDANHRLFV
jgi:hypothetical protein